MATSKVRKSWHDAFQALTVNHCQSGVLHHEDIIFKKKGEKLRISTQAHTKSVHKDHSISAEDAERNAVSGGGRRTGLQTRTQETHILGDRCLNKGELRKSSSCAAQSIRTSRNIRIAEKIKQTANEWSDPIAYW